MRPTRVWDLLLFAVATGVVAWALIRSSYGDVPKMQWYVSLSLPVLAVAEAVSGAQVRARIHRKPGTRPVDPLVAARTVALAKASAIVGAVMAGLWGGLLAYTVPHRNDLAAAHGDMVVAAVGVVGALLLVGAALWLEYCCRAPKPPDDDSDLDRRTPEHDEHRH